MPGLKWKALGKLEYDGILTLAVGGLTPENGVYGILYIPPIFNLWPL